MKTVAMLLSAAAFAGFGASTFLHIRGVAGAPGDARPLLLAVFCAGVVLTLAVLLAAWRIGIGRADGWWSRAMDGLSTWTYLSVAITLVYGIGAVAYTLWSQRGGPPRIHTLPIVAGATFMFFYEVLFAATRALGIASRTPRA
jgi:hypothetical protein